MAVQTTPANGIHLAFETFGDPSGRPLVLIMGLGMQMLAWPEEACGALVDRGFFVVRFDNRDAGLSTHLHDAPPPDLRAALAGDVTSLPTRSRTWPTTSPACSTPSRWTPLTWWVPRWVG